MSVEKMLMLNMIGHISELEAVSKKVVLFGEMHPINAIEEINTTDFTIKASEENKAALVDVCYIRPYTNERDYSSISKKIDKIKFMCLNEASKNLSDSELILDYSFLESQVDECYKKFQYVFDELKEKQKEEEEVTRIIKHLKYVEHLNTELDDLGRMTHFHFNLLKVSSDNIIKLKHNYENIPSIVISVYKEAAYEIVMSFTPHILKLETDRIFKSLNSEEIYIPMDISGTPIEIRKKFQLRLEELKREISELALELKKISVDNEKMVNILDKSLELEKLSSEIKENTAYTNEFFYMCGWIPERLLEIFKREISPYDERTVIIEKSTEEISKGIVPPTKLRNNFVVKPFESMVGMYGLPSYGELDPTTFLGISYMFMFGAMFGDVGQGLVFLIAGLLIKYMKHKEVLGGMLSRLGISSAIFGILYGSVFGFEDIIKPLFIRPMEEITEILVFAVIFGCILLIIGFIFSLINSIKRKDLENALFGKDGVTGLLFYVSILVFAISKYKEMNFLSSFVWVSIFLILLLLMLFKEPLANLIQNKRPLYSEGKGDYFIEEGFGVVETLLSMLSNTLSFIRVGAFALNHVGLFLAFSALAKMMSNSVESTFMYIIGNVVIIGLEGLIVFIQGLRLEYYELFSKYYEGSGISFEPVKLFNSAEYVEKDSNYKIIKKFLKSVEE